MAFFQIHPDLSTDPAVVETIAAMVLPLPFDLAPSLLPGETPSNPRTVLTDLETGERVSLPAPTLTGTTITQVIQRLTPGRDYQLVWLWTISPTKQPGKITVIRAVA